MTTGIHHLTRPNVGTVVFSQVAALQEDELLEFPSQSCPHIVLYLRLPMLVSDIVLESGVGALLVMKRILGHHALERLIVGVQIASLVACCPIQILRRFWTCLNTF